MADNDLKSRIVGKSTGRTILRLVIASIIVGAIFSFVGVRPEEFWRGIFTTARRLIHSLGESAAEIAMTLGTYLLIGAAIVIPIWLISRLLSSRK